MTITLKSKDLLFKIAELGKQFPSPPIIQDLFPFRNYFNEDNSLITKNLSDNDGLWSKRELLTRYLFLQAVLDQGPDIEGIRQLLKDVVNSLYEKEIRILHKPIDFFKEIGISIDEILSKHQQIKNIRAKIWAKENKSTASKYNLFMDNSKQVLGYAIYRWGVPLCVPYLLEKDTREETLEPLVEYLESWKSTEEMSQEIKDNERYGLGKAVGDKACHLFSKWYVHSFKLVKSAGDNWGKISFELPLDSNAGRVLFRTGFWLQWASLDYYESWEVIQKNAGKGGEHYIRVTNIRGKKSEIACENPAIMETHQIIATQHLKTHSRGPKKIDLQHIPNSLLYNSDYGIGDLDDGLIYIGTNFCFNHDTPKCSECPINKYCDGYNNRTELISDYRT
jgi:hypothetical protein